MLFVVREENECVFVPISSLLHIRFAYLSNDIEMRTSCDGVGIIASWCP